MVKLAITKVYNNWNPSEVVEKFIIVLDDKLLKKNGSQKLLPLSSSILFADIAA